MTEQAYLDFMELAMTMKPKLRKTLFCSNKVYNELMQHYAPVEHALEDLLEEPDDDNGEYSGGV